MKRMVEGIRKRKWKYDGLQQTYPDRLAQPHLKRDDFVMNFTNLVFFRVLPFILFVGAATAQPITRGKAIKDCDCKGSLFEDEWTVKIKKGEWVGDTCAPYEDKIHCDEDFQAGGTTCPANCIELKQQGPVSPEEWKAILKDPTTLKLRELYQSTVPKNILEALKKKRPEWIPTVYSKLAPNLLKLQSNERFYLQGRGNVGGVEKAISIVFYFVDLEHFKQMKWNWSFWLTETAELLYDASVPYPIIDGPYVNQPCVSPAGKNLERVVLFGITAGPSDAAGCCGPYTLDDLKKSGPVLVSESNADKSIFNFNVIYNKCSDVVDSKVLKKIDGPANIRVYHERPTWTKDNKMIPPPEPDKSEVFGTCADNATVVDLGNRGQWHHVVCEGKDGWTHKKNLRP